MGAHQDSCSWFYIWFWSFYMPLEVCLLIVNQMSKFEWLEAQTWFPFDWLLGKYGTFSWNDLPTWSLLIQWVEDFFPPFRRSITFIWRKSLKQTCKKQHKPYSVEGLYCPSWIRSLPASATMVTFWKGWAVERMGSIETPEASARLDGTEVNSPTA